METCGDWERVDLLWGVVPVSSTTPLHMIPKIASLSVVLQGTSKVTP